MRSTRFSLSLSLSVRVLIALAAVTACTEPSVGQQCFETPEAPAQLDPNDYFGIGVAVDGSHAIVGAAFDDDLAGNSGAAYIYTNPWAFAQKITANPGQGGNDFGSSVSISGDVVAVGSPGYPFATRFGAAYIFRRNSTLPPGDQWVQEGGALTASDGQFNDNFGGQNMGPSGVGISGNVLVVGAAQADFGGQESTGKAYIFRYSASTSSWQEQAILMAPSPQAGGKFGGSVAISGNRAIVGAPGQDRAFVYRAPSGSTPQWTLEQEIIGAGEPSQFGWSVAIDGTMILVGAPTKDEARFYRFSGTTWVQEQLVTGIPADQFGYGVSLSGSLAVVGAWKHDHPNGNPDVGAAYVFQRQAGAQPPWVQVLELLPQNSFGQKDDEFGGSVAIDGDDAFIGAFGDDPLDKPQAGAVYIYDTLPSCP